MSTGTGFPYRSVSAPSSRLPAFAAFSELVNRRFPLLRWVATSDHPPFRFGPALGEMAVSDDDPVPTDPVAPGGGEPLARPDMDRFGRGGSHRADDAALNLADRNDGLTLSREVTSRIDRDQIQRVETSRDRASNDDRREQTEQCRSEQHRKPKPRAVRILAD